MGLRAVTLSAALLVLAPAAVAQNQRVLWDTHHGIYSNYSLAGKFTALQTQLLAKGIDLVESNVGVLNENLSSYDAVVVSVLSSYTSAYSAAEADALQAYALGGGGVLVVGDNASVWPQNVNTVAARFGLTIGVSSAAGNLVTILDPTEEMFTGITSVHFQAGGTIGIGAGARSVGTTSAGDTMIARWDNGRVIAVGDGNMFDDSYIFSADNVAYADKLFEYLTQGCAVNLGPGTTGTGGVVPQLSAGAGSCGGPLSLFLQDAVGGSSVLLFVGTQAAQIPAAGGTLYVDAFSPPFVTVPLPLGGTAGVAGAGSTILAYDLTAYLPLTLMFQFAVYDSGGQFGFALSNGIQLDMAP